MKHTCLKKSSSTLNKLAYLMIAIDLLLVLLLIGKQVILEWLVLAFMGILIIKPPESSQFIVCK